MKIWLMLGLALCAGVAHAGELPPPVQALHKHGMTVVGELPAPSGFHGYLVDLHGRRMPVYLLPDGKHTVIGTLFDADGNDLTRDAFEAAVRPRLDNSTWKALADSTWISEGAKQPKRVIYVFSDTECPYCHRLWQLIQPSLRGGDVQVRYVIVAVIRAQSLGRAATILSASDPGAALRRHEQNYGHSPIKPLAAIPAKLRDRIERNNELMSQIGASGTPAIVYRDAGGKLQMIDGMPSDPARIRQIFGRR